MVEFKKWPKIPRLENESYNMTEKIDGTNGCVIVTEDGDVCAQSRERLLTLEKDNFGFYGWVQEHKDEFLELAPGYYYGEWWGKGIQRGYDLDERRFSLFEPWKLDKIPECCHVVPSLEADTLFEALDLLAIDGSYAAPGYNKPEGIILTSKLHGSDVRYKWIIEDV